MSLSSLFHPTQCTCYHHHHFWSVQHMKYEPQLGCPFDSRWLLKLHLSPLQVSVCRYGHKVSTFTLISIRLSSPLPLLSTNWSVHETPKLALITQFNCLSQSCFIVLPNNDVEELKAYPLCICITLAHLPLMQFPAKFGVTVSAEERGLCKISKY
jgi:hypothetical protein